MASRLLSLFRGRKRNGPAAAQAQQPEELEQFQPLQAGAGRDQRGEQDPPAPGRFRRAAQILRRFLCLRRRRSTAAGAQGTAEPDCRPTDHQGTAAAQSTAEPHSRPTDHQEQHEVGTGSTESAANSATAPSRGTAIRDRDTGHETPGMAKAVATLDMTVQIKVATIHKRLKLGATMDASLQSQILKMAEEHPDYVVTTLLHCAPNCDRAAAMMWRTLGSSEPAMEKVLPALLCVMEERPQHSQTFFYCFEKDAFALAATLALWMIAQVSQCQEVMIHHSDRLFVALLSQFSITTGQMPENIGKSDRASQEEHRLPTSPNRLAVQTMKALLCRVKGEDEVVALERKRLWDMLLCANTQLYAVGLLAREMRRGSTSLCSRIALRLLGLLNRQEPRWALLALAFLVEVLGCLDLNEYGDTAITVVSRHLPSKSRERMRLELRGLVVLSRELSLARKIHDLYPNLVEMLANGDGEMVWMTLSVLTQWLQQKDIQISSTTAQRLAEPLPPLFDNDNGHVRLLSIRLFCKVLKVVVEEGKQPLTGLVSQSLLPLFLHWHDENGNVAKASHEALFCVAQFLKRKDLEELLEKEQRMRFAECLLTQDESRAAEHLRRALPCLQSPQTRLRQAAIRVIGVAGVLMMGQKEELQLLSEALEALREDDSPSFLKLYIQLTFEGRAAELRSPGVPERAPDTREHDPTWTPEWTSCSSGHC